MRPRTVHHAAFSLVEVMVALVILGVAVAGLAGGLTTALRSTKDSEVQTVASFLAAGQIEQLRADGFVTDGVTQGEGTGGLASYKWTQTVTPTQIDGLHDVSVEVMRLSETKPVFELHTLLFDPPEDSLTNRPTADQRGGPGRSRDRDRDRGRGRNSGRAGR